MLNTLYLGVKAIEEPEGGDPPECGDVIQHRGQVSVYYIFLQPAIQPPELIFSVTAQFNGKGELLHVNGVRP